MFRKSILPRSVSARRRLTPREALWVYLPIPLAGIAFCLMGLGVWMGIGKDLPGDIVAVLLCLTGVGFIVIAGAVTFAILDDYNNSFRDRKNRIMRDRARRSREHKPKRGWKELHERHPQYAVEVKPVGSDMEFTVLRFEPPEGLWARRVAPWPCEAQRWDVSSERWSVQGHTLRVTDPQTNLLVEAYCEAAEAAKAMEKEAYQSAAKKEALAGMALAFTPPSGKTTNTRQLEAIRERVQSRRLLDSGD